MYDYLIRSVETRYIPIRTLSSGENSKITLLRHNASGQRFVFRRFEGTAEVYRKLLSIDCPHLPRIYEAAESGGKAAVLEEYIQGDSLDFLLQCEPFSPEATKEIAAQLCLALWVLHSRGIVHRDIKPENVILRGPDAVLIDLDASRLHKPESPADTRVLGTMGYAAPEQYGFAQTDGRADIYSLGVMMNVMLTLQHPSRSLVPGKMGRIIEKCTMTNPAKRYKSVVQLMEDLL